MDWIKALDVEKIDPHEGTGEAIVSGLRLAIYAVDGQYYATADECTHGKASLSQGYLEGYFIECPLHQGRFDVRTGEAVTAPCKIAVQSFPVKVENGAVYVQFGDADVKG